jgi:uncharacterized membrane protein YoaK (UPF0700 family)
VAQAKDRFIGIALGFVAGFVDAAGFIALSGLFTAHVTGNFVLIGAELVSSGSGVLAKLLALPAFVVAVAATRLIALALERRGHASFPWLFVLQAVLLSAFCATGLLWTPLGSPDGARAIGVGMLGVAAMGIQNAIARLSLSHLPATTVMTVNVTQAVLDGVDILRRAPEIGPARIRLGRMGPAILAFAVGALAGAFGIAFVSFWCLLLPILILAVLAATVARQ